MNTSYRKRKLLNSVRKCSQCGRRILEQGYLVENRLSHIMRKDRICYDCAFWQDLADYPPKHLEIVGNVAMKICPVADRRNKTILLGGKGKMRFFMRENWRVFQSNDIWIIGTVPERFRKLFEPTAVEISREAFCKLQSNHKKCNARACFDRYNCFRYNLELEKDGPFNKIPVNWPKRGERCRYFIDMDNFYINTQIANYGKKNQTTGGQMSENHG